MAREPKVIGAFAKIQLEPRGPKVIGAFARTHLQVMETHAEDVATRVRLAGDPEAHAAVEKCNRISWISLEHHVSITETMFAQAPADTARELCRRTVLQSFDQPFLKPLFRGAMALVGSNLARFASWTPKAWPAFMRDVGELSWTLDEPGSGRLVLSAAAPQITASRCYVEGLEGGFSAFFEVTRTEGEISASVSGDCVEFSFDWR